MDWQKLSQGYRNGGLLGMIQGAEQPSGYQQGGLLGLLGLTQASQQPGQPPAPVTPNLGMGGGPHPGMNFQPPNPWMPQQTMRDKLRNGFNPMMFGG